MRLTCKAWKRELDLCAYEVEPAFSDMQRTLKFFPNVQKLDLSACNLTVQNEDLFLMSGLKKLKVLDLRGCAAVSRCCHSSCLSFWKLDMTVQTNTLRHSDRAIIIEF